MMYLSAVKAIAHTTSVIKRTAYVQKYMHTWAHSGGSPLFLVNWFTRMRYAKNMMASIGANETVSVAV